MEDKIIKIIVPHKADKQEKCTSGWESEQKHEVWKKLGSPQSWTLEHVWEKMKAKNGNRARASQALRKPSLWAYPTTQDEDPLPAFLGLYMLIHRSYILKNGDEMK